MVAAIAIEKDIPALCATVRALLEREAGYAKVLHDRLRELNAFVALFDKLESEKADLHNAVSETWNALGITEHTGKHVSEHVAELRAENTALREQLVEARRLLADCESILRRIHQQSELLANTQEQPSDITRQVESLIRLIALIVDVLQRVAK